MRYAHSISIFCQHPTNFPFLVERCQRPGGVENKDWQRRNRKIVDFVEKMCVGITAFLSTYTLKLLKGIQFVRHWERRRYLDSFIGEQCAVVISDFQKLDEKLQRKIATICNNGKRKLICDHAFNKLETCFFVFENLFFLKEIRKYDLVDKKCLTENILSLYSECYQEKSKIKSLFAYKIDPARPDLNYMLVRHLSSNKNYEFNISEHWSMEPQLSSWFTVHQLKPYLQQVYGDFYLIGRAKEAPV